MLKPAPGHATPSKAEVEKALTIQNGEGPYQCADRLRKLLGYPDNTTDTLALAHLLGKDANGQFRHGQVLEIPSADASEAPAQPDYSPDEQPQRPRFIAPLLAPDQQIA
jgi:hypothetical protein